MNEVTIIITTTTTTTIIITMVVLAEEIERSRLPLLCLHLLRVDVQDHHRLWKDGEGEIAAVAKMEGNAGNLIKGRVMIVVVGQEADH